MEIYLVGGAVRDRLLGQPVKEKDWVVVGATAEDMLKKGYRQVGKDFPVFLHPKTHEEYALARVERKVSRGYTGFNFDASPQVTLEQDLLRRDLTINAIAQCASGILVDPYHGKADLDKKILRHVSPAFVEDPVRILRVGRFAARFADLGFIVAPETVALMQEMVKSGEVDALVAERVWKELERAIQEKTPAEFFHVLSQCDALPILFPTLKENNIKALSQAAALSADAEVRFSALLYDLSPQQIRDLCDRYRVPSSYRELALLVASHYPDYMNADQLNASQWLALLQAADAFRREPRFQKFLDVCEAVATASAKRERVMAIYQSAKQADIKKLMESGATGKDIADLLGKQRIDLIEKFLKNPKK
jgi:tRNA nucleotidyltransferase (CCA-adding enzyme)